MAPPETLLLQTTELGSCIRELVAMICAEHLIPGYRRLLLCLINRKKGTIEPGKVADLAVLSQDIFKVAASGLAKTESVLTMVSGKIILESRALAHSISAQRSSF
jgi:hypothetical protein